MKKRNPNDATFRNIDALKKRVKAVEKSHSHLRHMVAQHTFNQLTIKLLKKTVVKLESRLASLAELMDVKFYTVPAKKRKK